MVEGVTDEGSDESSMLSMGQDTLDEQDGLDWNGQMCANCHRQPSFEPHPDIAVTELPYYFDIQ